MSRIEKLYQCLSQLEDAYSKLVREEFQNQADGISSPWLFGRFPVHRKKPAPDDSLTAQTIDKLEREIIRTRRGLGAAVPGPAVAIARDFLDEFGALGVRQTDSDWIRLAREALRKIDEIATSRTF
ncbi:MAG: hypothetical protein EXS05_08390 [Planctomycetaceae bacterium]|nr:hypothetical protein [Planctomycetaceae bacterium]